MHRMYSSKKGDTLCPLGFHPQVRWPTRCKRCFRDYKDHGEKKGGNLKDIASSTPNLSLHNSTSERDSKRNWVSTTNLAKDDTNTVSSLHTSIDSKSATNLRSNVNDIRDTEESKNKFSERDKLQFLTEARSARKKQLSDSPVVNSDRTSKLQIKEVIQNSEDTAGNDVEFIIQVKKSPTRNSQNDVDKSENDTAESEIKRLRVELNEMKERCRRVEKEKSDILLRRLTSVEAISAKPSVTELIKLEKSVKALTEENSLLVAKVRSLERESYKTRSHKNEGDSATEDLRVKLKAAETLCESLMDENEEMKKEIRELEEEICEMHDNFREEQANEYTNLRKTLEQSNKNCRILSFKLKKLERTTEQLQKEKSESEQKLQEIKKIEDMLMKLKADWKKKCSAKSVEYSPKLQLKKIVDEMEKQIDNIVILCANASKDGIDEKSDENSTKYENLLREYNLLKQKFEDATKQLAEEKKGEKEKEKEKNREGKNVDDKMNVDFQNMKKKLDYTITSREKEKKAWDEEKEKLKAEIQALSAEKLEINKQLEKLKSDLDSIRSMEKEDLNKMKQMETNVSDLKKELALEKKKCNKLRNELLSCSQRESKFNETLTAAEEANRKLEADMQQVKGELEKSKSANKIEITNLNAKLAGMKKDKEDLISQMEKDKSARDSEVVTLKTKIASLEKDGINSTKISEMKANYTEKISDLTEKIEKLSKEHEHLNEEHKKLKLIKQKLEEENELVNSTLSLHKRDLINTQTELESLREYVKRKENEWQSEKATLEKSVQEYKTLYQKSPVDELKSEIEYLKNEHSRALDQLQKYNKINEDLTNKLKDYNAVSKAHQVLTSDTASLESEIQRLNNTLLAVERSKKADVAECKIHYERRITAISDQVQSLQNQLSRYKRERDTYKHMLEGAQKTIADLRLVKSRHPSLSRKSEEEEEISKNNNIFTLEQQISCMEDELSETKLESSRLRTELISEKSAWNVKLSEMQSRINELEEERILSSGRSKIPGVKVRMELAWQKERKEQQRLLEETATLARDLRQTLLEVERERAKERLENKRKQDQMKKAFNDEKEENKKKLIELQCDLLELRDAHAKLRTSNERMRRERERHDREKQDLKNEILRQRGLDENEKRSIDTLLQQVNDLQKLFPELADASTQQKVNNTPTPPRRLKGPKSRESSPLLDGKSERRGSTSGSVQFSENRTEKLEYTIKKLMDVAKELKESKQKIDAINAKNLMMLNKRSISVENNTGRSAGSSHSKRPLKMKSLSLEHTTSGSVVENSNIWRTDSDMSSLQSLESNSQAFIPQRDSSVDSRLSGGSTKSEMLYPEKKYKKSIIGKIKTKLVKSSSVDDANMSLHCPTSGSETSINEDDKEGKKNLKMKLSDMFKKNRSNRKAGSGESSRPPSRNSASSKT